MPREMDVGDEILSSGGLYGTVRGVSDDDDELFVEIAPGVEVRMDRRAVGAVVSSDETEAAEDAHETDAEPDEAAETAEPEPSAHGTSDRSRG